MEDKQESDIEKAFSTDSNQVWLNMAYILANAQEKERLFQLFRTKLLATKDQQGCSAELQSVLRTLGVAEALVALTASYFYLPPDIAYPDPIQGIRTIALFTAIEVPDLDAVNKLFSLEEEFADYINLGHQLIVLRIDLTRISLALRNAMLFQTALFKEDGQAPNETIYEKMSNRLLHSSLDLRTRDYKGDTLFTTANLNLEEGGTLLTDLYTKLVAKLCKDLQISDVIDCDPENLREIISLKKHGDVPIVMGNAFYVSRVNRNLRVWFKKEGGGTEVLTIPCKRLPDFFPWEKYRVLAASLLEDIKALAVQELQLDEKIIQKIAYIGSDNADNPENADYIRWHFRINDTIDFFISPTSWVALIDKMAYFFRQFHYEIALAQAENKLAALANPLAISEQVVSGKDTLPVIKLLLACNRETNALPTKVESYNGILHIDVSLLTLAMIENNHQSYATLRNQGKTQLVSDLPAMVSFAIRSKPSVPGNQRLLDPLFLTHYLEDMRESKPDMSRPYVALALEEAAYDENYAIVKQLLDAGIPIGGDTPLAAKFVLSHANPGRTFKTETKSSAILALKDLPEKANSDQWISFFKLRPNEDEVSQYGPKRSRWPNKSWWQNKGDRVKRLRRSCNSSEKELQLLDSNRELYTLYQTIAPTLIEVLPHAMASADQWPIYIIVGYLLQIQTKDFHETWGQSEQHYEDNFALRLFKKIRTPAPDTGACHIQLSRVLNNSYRSFRLLPDYESKDDSSIPPLCYIKNIDKGKLTLRFGGKAQLKYCKEFQNLLSNKFDIWATLTDKNDEIVLKDYELSKFLLHFAPEVETTPLFGPLPETRASATSAQTTRLCLVS